MSEYTVYDFAESLERSNINRADVERVEAAWGLYGDYSEWEGGFLMKMKSGEFAYLWGWCDTSGWGCQDGSSVEYYDEKPDLVIKRGTPQHFGGYLEFLSGSHSPAWEQSWDLEPADLNRWLQKEYE